jgi:L-cysteine desulfidase
LQTNSASAGVRFLKILKDTDSIEATMQEFDAALLLDVLKSEIRIAIGCTEVAAAALASAKAAETLGVRPSRLALAVSPNVYKNGARAGVPGTPLRGLAAAAALGAVIGRSDEGLGVLNAVGPDVMDLARTLLDDKAVKVVCDTESRENVYLRAEAERGGSRATAVIQEQSAIAVQHLIRCRKIATEAERGVAA